MELVQSNLELRILFNISLESFGFLSFYVNREITGLSIPESLVFRIGHELHEFPCCSFTCFVASLESPQGAAANRYAANVVSIDVREETNADFEGVTYVGQKGLQSSGGFKRDGNIAIDECLLGIVITLVQVRSDSGFLVTDELLPDGEDIVAGTVGIKLNSCRISFATTVVVVDIVLAHLAGPLFEEPAIVAHAETILCSAAFGNLGGHFIDFVEVFRRSLGIETSLFKSGLVVVQDGGRAVERHGVQCAVNSVVSRNVGLDDADVKAFSVDEFLHGFYPAAVDHETGADVINLHDVAGNGIDAGSLNLCESVIIGSLIFIIDLDLAFILSIEVFDHFGDCFTIDAAHCVPEGDFHGAVCRGDRADTEQHGQNQEQGNELFHTKDLLYCVIFTGFFPW